MTEVSENDVVVVTYKNSTTGREQQMRVTVTETNDPYMTEGEGVDGFKGKRHKDDKKVGVWPDGDVCTFGWQQSFIGEEAKVEIEMRGL